MSEKRILTGLWIYSDAIPEIITQSLKKEGITIIPRCDCVYGNHYAFIRTIQDKDWKGVHVAGSIVRPDPIDIPYYEDFFKGKTYSLKDFNSEIKIHNGIIQHPSIAIPTLKPVFDALKQNQINFVTTVTGIPNIGDLVGYHIEGKTYLDPSDRNNLVDLMR